MVVYRTYVFFCNVTLRCREFGSGREKFVVTPLKMKPFRCLERSRNRYQATLRHIAEGKDKAFPLHALRVPGGWGSQISRQSVHEGGKVVSPTHLPHLLVYIRGWVNPRAIVRPEELCQENIPMTPSGIEPANFRLVTQHLNKLRHCVPPRRSEAP
jgi:hypothetical protein